MTTLDELWGWRAGAGLQEALTFEDFPEPVIEPYVERPPEEHVEPVADTIAPSIVLRIDWGGEAWARLECWPGWCSFARLEVHEERRGEGLVSNIVRGLLPLYLRLGVGHVKITPFGGSAAIFERVGFERMPDGQWIGRVEHGARFEQYVHWRFKGGSEPRWHRRLGARDGTSSARPTPAAG